MNYKSKFTGKQIDDGIDKANSAYQKPQNGIPPKDLSEGVQNSLDKIDALPDHIVTDANYVHTDNNYTAEEKTKLANAITEEQDPTVPQWAKQPTKPSYTPQEVDALPANTPLFDGDYNDLENKPDLSGFITISVNNLVNYYLKSETYTKQEVHALIAAIQQFHYEIYASTSAVASPAGNVLYLIGPTGTGSDKHEEYVYDATKQEPWIKIGDTSVDLSGYYTSQQTDAAITSALNTASHSPKIVDSVWQVWDNSTQAYVSTGIKAVGVDGITPQIRINSDTKNWETSVDGGVTWADTGVSSISTNAEVVQVSGQETGKVMSQKAVTDAILNSFDQLNFTIFENSDGSIYKKIFTTPLADSVLLGVDKNSVSVYALPDMSNLTTLYYKFVSYNFTNFYAKIKTSNKLIGMAQILDGCVNLLSFDFTYFDTSNVTTLYYAMRGCINLKKIIGVINAKSVKTVIGFLDNCKNLEYFSGLAELKCSLYLKDCVKITHDSLISIIANLADMTTSDNQTWATNNNLTTTPTLTLGSTNLAKLTDAEKKVATDKNWIIA